MLITMGDPSGIGPEIIVKAFLQAPADLEGCVVVGDVAVLRRAAQLLGDAGCQLAVARLEASRDWMGALGQTPPRCIPVWQACTLDIPPPFGQVTSQSGRAAGDCVVAAARAVLGGGAAAMVTAPLHKEALAAAGSRYSQFPGHTEMLQAEAAAWLHRDVSDLPVRMMLANPELKTVLVSIHMSLREAIEAVTYEGVLRTVTIAHESLRQMLGRSPRIAVAGLNPHAGENGLFGREELDVILPAVNAARNLGILASGPHAPDTVFMRARSKGDAGNELAPGEFDVVVAMYHDQGLIPVKYMGVEQGVNVTLGLPLIRTSPDHGTAFDIAGTGRADPASLLAAIRMARVLTERRDCAVT
jgi:4-hydroxythreonine-4-phosphate dehydrogenase